MEICFKPLLVILLCFVIVLGFTESTVSGQASEESTAWAASVAFAGAGGVNRVDFGASNLGPQPVVICEVLRSSNGTAISSACTDSPIPSKGTSVGKSAAWWYAEQAFLGWSGSIVVYSKDGTTPIAPFGWVQIDQQGNRNINGAFGLAWVPTSAPS